MSIDDVSFSATQRPFIGGDKEANIYYTILGSNVSSKGREKLYLQDIADITRIDMDEVASVINGLIAKGNVQAVQDVFDSPLQVKGIGETMQSNLDFSRDGVILNEYDFTPYTRQVIQ